MTQVATKPASTNGQAQGNGQNLPSVQVEKTIADQVLNKIKAFQETGSIRIPKDYSPENALRAAWLILLETKTMDKRPVLEVCTKESIANSLLKMIVQGLNPVKKQCSFIAYGTALTCQREYAGTMAIAKRDAGVDHVAGSAVFKDDGFEYEIDPVTLQKKIIKHVSTLESMSSNEVKGAYAVKFYKDGRIEIEIMSMAQIRKAWEQGATKGQSPAHKNFPDQMAIKTVINRALKIDINSSDDSALFDDEEPTDTPFTATVKQEISDNANKKAIGFTDAEGEGEGSGGPAAEDIDHENVDINTGEVKEGDKEQDQQQPAGKQITAPF
jgi:recombination protein RecT